MFVWIFLLIIIIGILELQNTTVKNIQVIHLTQVGIGLGFQKSKSHQLTKNIFVITSQIEINFNLFGLFLL